MGEVRGLERQRTDQSQQNGSAGEEPLPKGRQAPFLPDNLGQQAADPLDDADGEEQEKQDYINIIDSNNTLLLLLISDIVD